MPFRCPRPADRAELLARRRNRKMARSAHAYVRGNTGRFYEWLAASAGDSLPAGPAIWICGDCHVGNLGPLAARDGAVGVQIRDLDQAVIGNPAHDLIRLGLSLASACRSANLPGAVSVRMVEALLDAYARAFGRRPTPIAPPSAIEVVMRQALARSWKQLARDHLSHTRPRIPLGSRFWPLSQRERRAIGEIFDPDALPTLAARLGLAAPDESVAFSDAAYWVKGCSSLGRLRYAILLEVGAADGKRRMAMVDMKEAPPAAAPRYEDAPMPRDNAARVVRAASALAPALGERMAAVRLLERPMAMRELLPQDLKIEPDRLPPATIDAIARYLGQVVGLAHAGQMDADTRHRWQRELRSSRSKVVDAPSWLWRSIVDALASHERGYLEHCRRHIATIERR